MESDIVIERNTVPQDLDDNTIACVEMKSTEPSYILYTSGTTGSLKVFRETLVDMQLLCRVDASNLRMQTWGSIFLRI